ncbi:MAG: hypothetical protein U5L09_01540 [Bacteroidales bacterium]|nr:hypothetical protein [Bacteroidales bacterium]
MNGEANFPHSFLQLQATPVWVDGLLETFNLKARNQALSLTGWKPVIHGIIFPQTRSWT